MKCQYCNSEIEIVNLPRKYYKSVCNKCNYHTSSHKTETEALNAFKKGQVADYNSSINLKTRL